MRVFYAIAIMSLLSAGCSKKSDSNTTEPSLITTVKFTGNGIDYLINGSSASTATGSILTRNPGAAVQSNYKLGGYELKTSFSIPLAGTASGTLTTGTYTTQAPASGEYGLNGSAHYTTNSGDYNTIVITKIHDGVYADGTFTGLLTKYNSTEKLTITGGVFTNVKIIL